MPQFSVDSRTIEHIIGYIKDGQIAIPEIQRPFVWDGTKIRNLIDSLYKGFPVGYLIVWQNPDMKDKQGNTTLGKKIMIDGQQRVTAIMTALVGLKVLDKDFKERVYKIAFNPFYTDEESPFEVQSAAHLKDKRWIADISVLFSNDFNSWDFVNGYCEKNPEMSQQKLNTLILRVQAIRNSPLGIINLDTSLTIDEVTDIFIRINSQGKSLTQSDFVMSTIAADTVHGGNILRKAIDYFCHLATNHDFISTIKNDSEFCTNPIYSDIKWVTSYDTNLYIPTYDDVLRVAFMTRYNRAKLQNLTDLLHGRNFEERTFENEILESTFAKLSDGVCDVVNKYNLQQFNETIKTAGFVMKKLVKGRMALDFAYTLYIRLHNDASIEKQKIQHYVKSWYVMSLLTARYSGKPESQMEADLRAIGNKGFVRFYDEVMENLGDTFWQITLPQDLQTSSSTAPSYIVYLAAQCQSNDNAFLSTGAKVRDLLDTADIHHIFPKQHLIDNGFKYPYQYNQVANYAVLNKPTNIAIGDRPPCEYFKEVYTKCSNDEISKFSQLSSLGDLGENCTMNSIPDCLQDMDYMRYEDFLTERRKLMAAKIKDYFYSL